MKVRKKAKKKQAATTWRLLCNEYPNEDEPIILKAFNKTYFGIRVIDEDGDFIHCQDTKNGSSVFRIDLRFMFNDHSYKWRLFDD